MPSVVLNEPIVMVQQGGEGAGDMRSMMENFSYAPGPVDWNSFRTTIVTGTTINVAQGDAFVRAPNDRTLYRIGQSGTDVQLTLTANNNGSLPYPRVDQLIARVYDDATDGSGQYQATVETIDGTPTSGATLDNRSGASDPRTALVNANAYIPLYDILVPYNTNSISALRRRTPIGQLGMVPPLAINVGDDLDQVTFIPHSGLNVGNRSFDSTQAGTQSAALMYLPRAIQATKVHFTYYVNVLASGTKNYKIFICDASGQKICDTGGLTWSGSSGFTKVVAALTLPYSGYIFDIGNYYVGFTQSGSNPLVGNPTSGGDQLIALAAYAGNNTDVLATPIAMTGPNMFLGNQTGGNNLQTSLVQAGTAFYDLSRTGAGSNSCPVPVVSLSQ